MAWDELCGESFRPARAEAAHGPQAQVPWMGVRFIGIRVCRWSVQITHTRVDVVGFFDGDVHHGVLLRIGQMP